MITASADTTAKLWDVKTGRNYFTFSFDRQGARGAAFSLGGREVVVTVDPFMGTGASIRIFRMFEDRAERAWGHAAQAGGARTHLPPTQQQSGKRYCRSSSATRGASRAPCGAR